MNKINLIFFISILSLVSCQISEQKTENNHEFDKGSKIGPIEASTQKVKNLALLGKLWGFLKYYHPNIAKGEISWDYELFRILPEYNNTKSIYDRDKILLKWVKRLGEFKADKDSMRIEAEIKMKPDLDWITNSDLEPELVQQLTKIKTAKRINENYYVKLQIGVGNPIFTNENSYGQMKFPDTGYRLLSLFRYWNIIQYYFPYKYLIDEDWNDVLKEFIPKFIDASNELEYKFVVLKLIARIHDTHANILGNDSTLSKFKGLNYVPVELKFVENKAIVTDYFDEELGKKTGLLKGDIVSKINNETIDEIVKRKLKYTSASNYPTQLRNIAFNLLRTNGTKLNIQYIRNKKVETVELKAYSKNKLINIYKEYLNKDTCFRFIKPNIEYLYLGSIKTEYLGKIMKKIENTDGLIIDLRCYPSEFVVFSLGEYLVMKDTEFVKFTHGSIKNPGLFTFTEILKVSKMSDYFYKGKVVILVNEMTQSQAEYTAMAFRVAPKATVIGSTTAGADGNFSGFSLPGGIKTGITGIGVYYPDGRETQRVGIIPDIVVKPTIKGIKQGKDEVLEKAIEIINVN